MALEISRMLYFAWKFGISDKGAKKAKESPKKDNDISCLGAGTSGGKSTSRCESTISMAYREVKSDDIKSYAMWRRENKVFSSIPI